MNKTLLRKLSQLSLCIASTIVVFFYFFSVSKDQSILIMLRSSHLYYAQALKSIVYHRIGFDGSAQIKISPFFNLVLLAIILMLLIYLLNRRGIQTIKIKIKPIYLLLATYLVSFLLLFQWVNLFEARKIVLLNFFAVTTPIVVVIVLIFLITAGAGKTLLKKATNVWAGTVETFLFSFGLGVFVFTALIFLLGLFKLITFYFIFAAVLIVGVFCWKEVIFWAKQLVRPVPVSINLKINNSQIWIMLFLLIIFSQSFLKLLSPIPWGNDEIIKYLNDTKLLATTHSLIKGGLPYPWALYDTIPYVLLKNSVMGARILTFSIGFFVLLGLYVLIKNYAKLCKIKLHSSLPLLLASIFISMPMVLFQLTSDLKVDLISFFMAIVAMLAWIKWEEARNANKPQNDYLKICSFFAGFSILIKPTSIILFLPLFLFILAREIKLKNIKKIVGTFFLVAVFFFSSFIYFVPYNILTWKTRSPGMILSSHNPEKAKLIQYFRLLNKTTEQEKGTEYKETQKSLLQSEKYDYNRFSSSHSKIKTLLFSFLDKSFNLSQSGAFVDIGYVCLLLVVSIIFAAANKKPKNYSLLALHLLITSYALWLMFCKQIPWYGLTVFIPLLFLSAESLTYQSGKILKFFIAGWLILVLVLELTINSATTSFGRESILGLSSKQEADKIEDYSVFLPKNDYEKINTLVEASGGFLYTNNCLNSFYLDKNYDRVLCDTFLTYLNDLYYDRDAENTAERFKRAHITYVLFDKRSKSTSEEGFTYEKLWKNEIPKLFENGHFKQENLLTNKEILLRVE